MIKKKSCSFINPKEEMIKKKTGQVQVQDTGSYEVPNFPSGLQIHDIEAKWTQYLQQYKANPTKWRSLMITDNDDRKKLFERLISRDLVYFKDQSIDISNSANEANQQLRFNEYENIRRAFFDVLRAGDTYKDLKKSLLANRSELNWHKNDVMCYKTLRNGKKVFAMSTDSLHEKEFADCGHASSCYSLDSINGNYQNEADRILKAYADTTNKADIQTALSALDAKVLEWDAKLKETVSLKRLHELTNQRTADIETLQRVVNTAMLKANITLGEGKCLTKAEASKPRDLVFSGSILESKAMPNKAVTEYQSMVTDYKKPIHLDNTSFDKAGELGWFRFHETTDTKENLGTWFYVQVVDGAIDDKDANGIPQLDEQGRIKQLFRSRISTITRTMPSGIKTTDFTPHGIKHI